MAIGRDKISTAARGKAANEVQEVPSSYGIGGLPFFGYRLAVTAKLFDRKFIGILKEHSTLNLPQWRAVAQLGLSEPGTVRSLADGAAVDRAEVSRSLVWLVEQGFVSRDDNSGDQRSPLFTLTPQGRTVYEQVRKPVARFIRELIEQVDPADVEAADRVLWTIAQGCLD